MLNIKITEFIPRISCADITCKFSTVFERLKRFLTRAVLFVSESHAGEVVSRKVATLKSKQMAMSLPICFLTTLAREPLICDGKKSSLTYAKTVGDLRRRGGGNLLLRGFPIAAAPAATCRGSQNFFSEVRGICLMGIFCSLVPAVILQ